MNKIYLFMMNLKLNLVFPRWSIEEQAEVLLIGGHSIVINVTCKNVQHIHNAKQSTRVTSEQQQVASVALHNMLADYSIYNSPELEPRPIPVGPFLQEDNAADGCQSSVL
jgi:hypothetical protein